MQPLKDIGEVCRSKKVFFHSDCAQMLGKVPISVDDMKIDLMSLTAHKIYGPKGVGVCARARTVRSAIPTHNC